MKVLIFEDISDKQNIFQRHYTIMRNLLEWIPEELTIEIVEKDNFTINFDVEGNIIIAHFTDVQKYCPALTSFNNAFVLFHTFKWELPDFLQDKDVKKVNNWHNRYCCPSKLLVANINSFLQAIKLKTNNPYFKLIGFNPALEEFLLKRLESDRKGMRHENYDDDFSKIKNILLTPKL
jgi:hypothetical protein